MSFNTIEAIVRNSSHECEHKLDAKPPTIWYVVKCTSWWKIIKPFMCSKSVAMRMIAFWMNVSAHFDILLDFVFKILRMSFFHWNLHSSIDICILFTVNRHRRRKKWFPQRKYMLFAWNTFIKMQSVFFLSFFFLPRIINLILHL